MNLDLRDLDDNKVLKRVVLDTMLYDLVYSLTRNMMYLRRRKGIRSCRNRREKIPKASFTEDCTENR